MATIKSYRLLSKIVLAIFFVMVMYNLPRLNAQSGHSVSEAGVITMTTANFDSLVNSQGVALVDFWARWCGPCLMQAPIIEEVKNEVGNSALIGKLDVDRNTSISRRYSIGGIPALLIFKDGVVVEKLVGYQQKAKLLASLKKYIQ